MADLTQPSAQRKLIKRLMEAGATSLLIKVASAGTSYLMLVAFARMLNAEDYGHFGLMLNLSIFLAAVFGLGLPTAIMRYWPTHFEKGEMAEARGLVSASLRSLTISSTILVCATIILTFYGWQIRILGFSDAWIVVGLLAISFSFGDYFSGALRAQGSTIWALAPRDILWRIVSPCLALAVMIYAKEGNERIAIYSCLAVMVLVFLAQLFYHIKLTKRLAGRGAKVFHWSDWRKPLVPLWGASVLFALIQQADVILVGAMLTPADTGAYFAAQKTASLLSLVMIAGGLVAAPMIAASYHNGRMAELQRICRLLAIAIAATTLLGFVFLAFTGKLLLSIFDPHYVTAYPVLMALAFGFAIDAMAGPSAYLMQMTKLEWVYLRVMAVVYALVFALQITFVPRYGILAAALSTAAGVVIWNVLAVTLLRREIKIDPSVFSIFRKNSFEK
jgi:O-antigen/teichoic acid export membrane protein